MVQICARPIVLCRVSCYYFHMSFFDEQAADTVFSLKHPFFFVNDGARTYYGGSQKLLTRTYTQKMGCGVICAANILLYLGRYAEGCDRGPFAELAREDPIPAAEFGRRCDALQRRYMQVMPHFGLTGLQLTWGLNRYCRRYGLPYRMRWQLGKRDFWQHIREMLEADIPATLAIGPNFPAFWGRHKLRFYLRHPEGYRPVVSTKAHFVTITGMNGEWLRISSWGREYFINRREYDDYVSAHSAWLVSNIGLMRRIA